AHAAQREAEGPEVEHARPEVGLEGEPCDKPRARGDEEIADRAGGVEAVVGRGGAGPGPGDGDGDGDASGADGRWGGCVGHDRALCYRKLMSGGKTRLMHPA